MSYKVLTDRDVYNTGIDGARGEFFNSGMRDGIVQGALNEGLFVAAASNVISFDTCELRVSGHRIVIDEPFYQTLGTSPSTDTRYSLIAQVIVSDNDNVDFSLFIQTTNTPLIQDNLFATTSGTGTYQVEIGRFTQQTDGTITDVVRTIDVITGGTGRGGGGTINVGNVTTQKIEPNLDAEVDIDTRYDEDEEKEYIDFKFSLPIDMTNTIQKADTALSNSQIAVTTAGEARSIAQEANTTADSAEIKADTAISTANTANSTASQANTTSNQAKEQAQSAETKADSAVTTAGQANTTANSALQTANSADSKSDTAISTANNAISTANTASTNANNAVQTANDTETFVEHLVDTPDISEAGNVGTPSVEFVNNVVDGITYKKFKFSNLKGDTGDKGEKGDTGAPNTLTIGTVTTGAAGSQASATITGTAPNQTLNLVIPRGDTGAQGEMGGKTQITLSGNITPTTTNLTEGYYYDAGYRFQNRYDISDAVLAFNYGDIILGNIILMNGLMLYTSISFMVCYSSLSSVCKSTMVLDGIGVSPAKGIHDIMIRFISSTSGRYIDVFTEDTIATLQLSNSSYIYKL